MATPARRDWAPVQRMIEAAQERWLWESERLRDLLKQSNVALAPLEDPLLTDFGTHRWLSKAREGAYSDWLMWIVEQLQTPVRVFQLFGIDDPSGVALCQGTQLTVHRELPVPHGHDDQSGQLDFVACYAGQAIIVVEVKKGGADAADTDKQRGYMKWLKQQPEPHKHAILLVTDADREDYHGFHPFLWSSLCIKLRQMVPELLEERRSVVAAMILAFVGAVEQNLLRFSAQLVQRIYAGETLKLSSEIGTHIKASLRGVSMTEDNNNNDSIEERFFEAGVPSYLDAMVALREFRIMVCQKCKTVLTSCLADFAGAIGLPLILRPIEDHINPGDPNGLRNWDGSWAWLAVHIALPGCGRAYFGLVWLEQEPRVIAMIHFQNLELFRKASLRVTSSVFKIYPNASDGEIMLYEPIRADQFRDFEGILTRVIDEWSRVWRDIGGLSAL